MQLESIMNIINYVMNLAVDPGFLEGGSNNYIHKRGWVLEGACPLP